MSDYFVYPPLTANTVARAADVNARFMGVSAGFDKLPPPDYIKDDRVTFAPDEGTTNALIIHPALPITAYTLGLHIRVQAANRNTGVATINVSDLGVKQIIRSDGSPLEEGDIVVGQMLDLVYDGLAFQLAMAFAELSPAGLGEMIEAIGDVDISGDLDVAGDVFVVDEPYGPGWDNDVSVPTKNAVYDEIQALAATIVVSVSNAPYGPSWNGVASLSPSQDAVYDKFVSVDAAIATKAAAASLANYLPLTGGTLTGNLNAPGFLSGGNIQGASFALDKPAGQQRPIYFQSAGVYVASISLEADNGTLLHNTPTKHQFQVGGALAVEINATQTRISSAQLVLPGTAPTILLGTGPIGRIYGNGTTQFYRADAHSWLKESAGTAQMDLSGSGVLTAVSNIISTNGSIFAQTNRRCFQQGSPGIGPGAEIFAATAAPTAGDGNNGDIWLQYV